jgi:hypothetical protein
MGKNSNSTTAKKIPAKANKQTPRTTKTPVVKGRSQGKQNKKASQKQGKLKKKQTFSGKLKKESIVSVSILKETSKSYLLLTRADGIKYKVLCKDLVRNKPLQYYHELKGIKLLTTAQQSSNAHEHLKQESLLHFWEVREIKSAQSLLQTIIQSTLLSFVDVLSSKAKITPAIKQDAIKTLNAMTLHLSDDAIWHIISEMFHGHNTTSNWRDLVSIDNWTFPAGTDVSVYTTIATMFSAVFETEPFRRIFEHGASSAASVGIQSSQFYHVPVGPNCYICGKPIRADETPPPEGEHLCFVAAWVMLNGSRAMAGGFNYEGINTGHLFACCCCNRKKSDDAFFDEDGDIDPVAITTLLQNIWGDLSPAIGCDKVNAWFNQNGWIYSGTDPNSQKNIINRDKMIAARTQPVTRTFRSLASDVQTMIHILSQTAGTVVVPHKYACMIFLTCMFSRFSTRGILAYWHDKFKGGGPNSIKKSATSVQEEAVEDNTMVCGFTDLRSTYENGLVVLARNQLEILIEMKAFKKIVLVSPGHKKVLFRENTTKLSQPAKDLFEDFEKNIKDIKETRKYLDDFYNRENGFIPLEEEESIWEDVDEKQRELTIKSPGKTHRSPMHEKVKQTTHEDLFVPEPSTHVIQLKTLHETPRSQSRSKHARRTRRHRSSHQDKRSHSPSTSTSSSKTPRSPPSSHGKTPRSHSHTTSSSKTPRSHSPTHREYRNQTIDVQ